MGIITKFDTKKESEQEILPELENIQEIKKQSKKVKQIKKVKAKKGKEIKNNNNDDLSNENVDLKNGIRKGKGMLNISVDSQDDKVESILKSVTFGVDPKNTTTDNKNALKIGQNKEENKEENELPKINSPYIKNKATLNSSKTELNITPEIPKFSSNTNNNSTIGNNEKSGLGMLPTFSIFGIVLVAVVGCLFLIQRRRKAVAQDEEEVKAEEGPSEIELMDVKVEKFDLSLLDDENYLKAFFNPLSLAEKSPVDQQPKEEVKEEEKTERQEKSVKPLRKKTFNLRHPTINKNNFAFAYTSPSQTEANKPPFSPSQSTLVKNLAYTTSEEKSISFGKDSE